MQCTPPGNMYPAGQQVPPGNKYTNKQTGGMQLASLLTRIFRVRVKIKSIKEKKNTHQVTGYAAETV
jgi:hypothetical protein